MIIEDIDDKDNILHHFHLYTSSTHYVRSSTFGAWKEYVWESSLQNSKQDFECPKMIYKKITQLGDSSKLQAEKNTRTVCVVVHSSIRAPQKIRLASD